MYDKNNVFAKILRGEIPCDKIYEDEFALSFQNIAPKARVHVLVIPKGEFINIIDFTKNASAEEQAGFWNAVFKTSDILNNVVFWRMLVNIKALCTFTFIFYQMTSVKMICDVRVIPRAKFNKIELPKIWVTAAPTDGDANKKVIEMLSDYFHVPKSRIKLIRGETSRDKVFDVPD